MDATSRAQIIVTAKDEASAVIKGIGDAAKQIKPAVQEGAGGFDAMGMAGKALGAIGLNLSLAGIATGAIAAGKAALDMGMRMEQTKVAFTTMMGGADAANEHLRELREFANSTPFEFTDLTNASKRMQAFGFEAKNVIPMLTDIGDAAAGLGGGAPMIDRLTLALGQMSAKGKVSAGEMLQLTEAGIPAWKYLAESVGVSTAEVMKLSEKGLVPADKAIQAILDGMRQDFGGMMAQQSQTASGKLSTLNDKLADIGTTLGTKMVPAANSVIDALTYMADGLATLVTIQDKMKAAYAQHSGDVLKTAGSYEEYTQELKRAASVAGLSVDAEGNLVRVMVSRGITVTEIIQKNYALSESLFATGQSVSLLVDDEKRLIGTTIEAGQAIGETKEQMEMNKSAVDALNAVMAGAVGKELQGYADKQTELKDKAEEYRLKIEELSSVPYLTEAQRAELDETKSKLQDTNTALDENAAAHEESMKRIVFSMLQGQLATDGFTSQEVAALTTVAEKWGLIDPATKAATDAISTALSETAANDDWENLDERINNITNGLLGIPNTIDIAINFRRNVYGDPPPEAGDIGLPGGDSAPVTYGNVDSDNGSGGDGTVPHAFGGVAVPGLQHVMNESIYSRPETFVTGQVGTVFTRQQMEAALSGGGGGSELLLAEMRGLPRTIARALRDQLQFLPR